MLSLLQILGKFTVSVNACILNVSPSYCQVKAIVKSAVIAIVFVIVVNVNVVVVVCVLLFHCLPQSLSFLSSYTL